MMRRSVFFGGIVALTMAVLAVPAQAGGKRLPKPISLVERIPATANQTHYVRTVSTRPNPAQSSSLRIGPQYSQSHGLRESPPVR
jgi:hypothetical protein